MKTVAAISFDQDKLNVTSKSRSNIFNWRGQFTPEFVEYIINTFARTAAKLKQGCPMSRYYLIVEYLDMELEDCRLTSIDNVFLIRHAKRLPFGKRTEYEVVKKQHQDNPIDHEVIWKFISELQLFVKSIWYDPEKALERGSFI